MTCLPSLPVNVLGPGRYGRFGRNLLCLPVRNAFVQAEHVGQGMETDAQGYL